MELCDRFGKETYLAALQALLDRTLRGDAQLIQVAIPEEPQTFEDYIDDDGLGNGPFKMKLTIWREGDHAFFDWSGTDPAGPRTDQLLPLRGHVQDVHRDLPDHGQRSPDPLQRRLLSRCCTSSCRREPAASALPGRARLPHARARAPLRRPRRRALQAGARAEHRGRATAPARTCSTRAGTRRASSSTRWRSSTAASPAGRSATAWTGTRGGRSSRTSRRSTSRRTTRCGSTATRPSPTPAAPGFHRGGNGVEKRYVYLEPGEVSIHDDRWLTRPVGRARRLARRALVEAPRRADGTEETAPVEVRPASRSSRATCSSTGRPAAAAGRTGSTARSRRSCATSRSGSSRRENAKEGYGVVLERRRHGRRRGHRGGARAPARGARRGAGLRLRAAARGVARALQGGDRARAAAPGEAASLVAARARRRGAGARPRGRRHPGAARRREARGLPRAGRPRRAAGAARRRRERRLHRPGVARSPATSKTSSARSRGCSGGPPGGRCRSSTRPSPTTRQARRRAATFIEKVPALLTLEAGSRVGRDRPADRAERRASPC